MREADVAIRMKEPSQSDLIRRRLLNIRMRLYASPDYIAAHGAPESLADLSNHRLICQKPDQPQVAAGARLVQELMSQNVGSTLTVNNYFGVLQAVLANLGIGVLPDYLTADHKRLVRVLPNIESGEVPVFLISLKAGGRGLNLTAADTVIHYDPWWNPAAENQATDRAHRIGQDKPVFVYKLIARGSVEEKIQQLQQAKANLAKGVLDGGSQGQWQLDEEDLAALFAPLD